MHIVGLHAEADAGKTSVFRYSLKGAVGDVELRFRFYRGEKEVETSSAPYQVVPGSVPATGLIDGCWISICHWSEQEAVFFNSELKKCGTRISNGISRRCPFLEYGAL